MDASDLLTHSSMFRGHRLPMAYGDKIRAARRRVGWTQRQLAEAIGVSKGLVAQWEGEAKKAPGRENLLRAARALGVSFDELLEDETSERENAAPTAAEVTTMTELFRRLSPRRRRICLALLQEWVDERETIEHPNRPTKGLRAVR